jgi:prepilin-type N-terminal cleavage/methylation domain-containing protein
MQVTRTSGAPARGGFTLMELLLVFAILAVLASLGTSAMMKMLDMQKRNNTRQVVSRCNSGLQQQWKAVIDAARTDQVNPIAVALSGNDGMAPNRARVIHVLMCLRREFPVNFTEATQAVSYNNYTFNPNQAYVRALSGASPASLLRSAEDQSSACLYLALKQRRGGSDFDPDTALSTSELRDPFNDGIKEIYDAWQRPVIFNRWPYVGGVGISLYGVGAGSPPLGALVSFNPSAPADKEDPEGLLTTAGWLSWVQGNNLSPIWLGRVGYPLAGNASQYQMTPVILSVGSNGKYDAGADDDIINYLLR